MTILVACGGTGAQERHVRERAAAYEPLLISAAARHGVDPRLLWAIAYQETRFRPRLISPKGARGLMQFIPATAARYGLSDPFDPARAVDAAARYVRDLSRKFGNDARLILAAYNSGEGTVEAYRTGRTLILPTGKVINASGMKTGGVPPYRETRGYVSGGLAVYQNISLPGAFNAGSRPRAPVSTAPVEPLAKESPIEPERSLYVNELAPTPDLITRVNEPPTGPPIIPQTTPPPPAPDSHGGARTRSIYIP